jgi:FKBP-type peptidyl-prolyl cis-trans isomerase
MKTGEIADFSINYEYAYGENGNPPTIPPKATLNLFIVVK